MKGQASYPFSMVEASFTFILLMAVAFGTQSFTQEYFKEETVDIRADRVERAATVLEDYPSGVLGLSLDGYEFKIEGSTFQIRFDETSTSRDLSHLNYSSIEGPSNFEKINDFCLDKNFENELEFRSC